MDARTDAEERIIALKLMIEEHEITTNDANDANNNTECHLIEIEHILEDNGLIVGCDFNTITNKVLDQKDYIGEHTRTKATKKLREWETTKKLNDFF